MLTLSLLFAKEDGSSLNLSSGERLIVGDAERVSAEACQGF